MVKRSRKAGHFQCIYAKGLSCFEIVLVYVCEWKLVSGFFHAFSSFRPFQNMTEKNCKFYTNIVPHCITVILNIYQIFCLNLMNKILIRFTNPGNTFSCFFFVLFTLNRRPFTSGLFSSAWTM